MTPRRFRILVTLSLIFGLITLVDAVFIRLIPSELLDAYYANDDLTRGS